MNYSTNLSVAVVILVHDKPRLNHLSANVNRNAFVRGFLVFTAALNVGSWANPLTSVRC